MPSKLLCYLSHTDFSQAVRECNVTITHYAGEKLHRLVILAKKVFQTRMAAISFIDDRNEIFKSEQSFYKVSIPRKNSIGAHVLFSNEPMVVLNTTEVSFFYFLKYCLIRLLLMLFTGLAVQRQSTRDRRPSATILCRCSHYEFQL